MSAINRVNQLSREGMTKNQIIDTLKKEGIAPKDILDALSRSELKTDLNATEQAPDSTIPQSLEGYNQSNLNTQQPPANQGPPQLQQQPQAPAQNQYNPPQNSYEPPLQDFTGGANEYQYQDNNPQDFQGGGGGGYDQGYSRGDSYYQEYEAGGGTDLDTVNDIAEQTFEEKFNPYRKQLDSFSVFMEEAKSRINNINERLTKIEDNLANIQSAIIRRLGEYSEDIKNISKEMHKNQELFTNILDPDAKHKKRHR